MWVNATDFQTCMLESTSFPTTALFLQDVKLVWSRGSTEPPRVSMACIASDPRC